MIRRKQVWAKRPSSGVGELGGHDEIAAKIHRQALTPYYSRGHRVAPGVHRTEHLPLSAPAASLVASILQENSGSQYLFPGNVAGEHLTDIKKFWAAAIRKASIPDYRRHDNRHTYASHLVSSGLSLEIVGRLLGHTSPSTTKRYAHLADDRFALLRSASDPSSAPTAPDSHPF